MGWGYRTERLSATGLVYNADLLRPLSFDGSVCKHSDLFEVATAVMGHGGIALANFSSVAAHFSGE